MASSDGQGNNPSLQSVLSTQQNGVVAINSIANTMTALFNFLTGMQVFSGPGTTSASVLYTVPAGQQLTLQDVEVTNTAGSSGSFTIYLVPAGGSPAASNAWFAAQAITANNTFQWKGSVVVPANYTVQALTSATTINLNVTGGISNA